MSFSVNAIGNNLSVQQNLSANSIKNQNCSKVSLQNDSVSFGSAEKSNKKSKAKKWIAGVATVLVGAASVIMLKKGFEKVQLNDVRIKTEDIGNMRSFLIKKIKGVKEDLDGVLSSKKAKAFIESADMQNAKIIKDEILITTGGYPCRIVTKEFSNGTKVSNAYTSNGINAKEFSDTLLRKEMVSKNKKIVSFPSTKQGGAFANGTEALILNKDGSAKIIGKSAIDDHINHGVVGKVEKNAKGQEVLVIPNLKESEVTYPFGSLDYLK